MVKKKRKKISNPPGTLIYEGELPPVDTIATQYNYDEENFSTVPITIENVNSNEKNINNSHWIRIIGLKDTNLITSIFAQFDIHPLVIEDIFATSQRTKYEDYSNYIYIVLRNIYLNDKGEEFENDQISLILTKDTVISIEERETPIFKPIIDRLLILQTRIRSLKSDYLLYSMVDTVVDNYFYVIESMEGLIDDIEDPVIHDPKPVLLQRIYHLKREINNFRKVIWPFREVINKFQREETPLIASTLQIYLRDLYDHIFRLSDLIESQRDIIFGMLDMYLSSISNKMNDIMKVLTIISTIFIPLSFLSGFYGMNFQYMPELGWRFSYPLLIMVMVAIAGFMLYFFKRRNYI